MENRRWSLNSPDGSIEITAALDGMGCLSYSIAKDGNTVVKETYIGLELPDVSLTRGLTFSSVAENVVDETYSLPGGGKKGVYHNHCNTLEIGFAKDSKNFTLMMRAYDDGAAYRIRIDGDGPATVLSETGGFGIPEGAEGWAMNFINNYEGTYDARTYGELTSETGDFSMPVLLRLPSGFYMLLTEACVDGSYCASHLHGDPDGALKIVWAEDQDGPIYSEFPLFTPWRLAVVTTDLDALLNSTTVYDLNPPSKLEDTSWIKGGRVAWNWWADMPNNLETGKLLVDFAESMGWEYVLMDAGWDESWISELVGYAAPKGVGIFVWEHHSNLDTDEKVDDMLPRWASYGIKGIKVDFFDSDCQTRMQEYDRITRKTAELKLITNYHGATKPTGEERTWPHILTREGIKGAEYYKWSEGNDSAHNCTVPFTRNAVGPMDYTPVTYSNNRNQTTWAHQTALAVIFESHIQHMADHPDWYKKSNAMDFLRHVPAGWDETRVIEGSVGEYVTMARRRGDDWFIGAICNGVPRTASVPLSFLAPGSYAAHIFKDGSQDTIIDRDETAADSGAAFSIPLRANGGCAIHIQKVK